jgi:hypothetical protein
MTNTPTYERVFYVPDTVGMGHAYQNRIDDVLTTESYIPYNQDMKHDGVFSQTSFDPPSHYNFFLCELVDSRNKKPNFRDTVMAVDQLGTAILQHKIHGTYEVIRDLRSMVGKVDVRRSIRLFTGRKSELFLYARGNTSRVNVFSHSEMVSAPLAMYSEYFRIPVSALRTVAFAEALLTWNEIDTYPHGEELFLDDIRLFDEYMLNLERLCERDDLY